MGFSIVPDTTGAAWTAEWFIDATSVRSETYGPNPTINYVGFGRENGHDSAIDNFTLTVAAPTFAQWIADFPGAASDPGFEGDPDGDGKRNGLENYFGTNPGVADNAGLVAGAIATGGGTTFSFTHPLNTDPAPARDVSATYRWSTNLATFHDDGFPNGAGTTTVSFQQPTASGGMVAVTASINGSVIPYRLFVVLGGTRQN